MKKYKCYIHAEVQTPLHNAKTGELLPDYASYLMEEIGESENAGAGFGYRDASGPTRFATFEEAFKWEREIAVRLERLFPPEIAGNCPPRGFIFANLDEEWADFSDDHQYLEVEVEAYVYNSYPLDDIEVVVEDIDWARSEETKEVLNSLIGAHHSQLGPKD